MVCIGGHLQPWISWTEILIASGLLSNATSQESRRSDLSRSTSRPLLGTWSVMKLASWTLRLLGLCQGIVAASSNGGGRVSNSLKPKEETSELHTRLQACKDIRGKLSDFYSYYGTGACDFRLKDHVIEAFGNYVDELEFAVTALFMSTPNMVLKARHEHHAFYNHIPSLSQPAKDFFTMLHLNPALPVKVVDSAPLMDNPSVVYWRFRRFEVKFDHLRRLVVHAAHIILGYNLFFGPLIDERLYAEYFRLSKTVGTLTMQVKYLSELTSRITRMNNKKTLVRLYNIIRDVLKEITSLLPVAFEQDVHTVLRTDPGCAGSWEKVNALDAALKAEFLTELLDAERTPANVKLAIWKYHNRVAAYSYFLRITHFQGRMDKATLSRSTAQVLLEEMQDFLCKQPLESSSPSTTSTPGDAEAWRAFSSSLDEATDRIRSLIANTVSKPNIPRIRKIDLSPSKDEDLWNQAIALASKPHDSTLVLGHGAEGRSKDPMMIISNPEEPKDPPASQNIVVHFNSVLNELHRHLLHYSAQAKAFLSRILANTDEDERERELFMVLPNIVRFLVAGRNLEVIHGSALSTLTVCTPDIGISQVIDDESAPSANGIQNRVIPLETPC